MIHAIFYMYQNSGAGAGMCMYDCTHQMKCHCESFCKIATVSQRERNALICFNKEVQINNFKMETFSFHQPVFSFHTNLTNL